MYYSADELKEKCPIFFKGHRNSWSLINAGVVDEDCYIFAKCDNGTWIKSTNQSKKFNKVFLLDSWVESNVPEFNDQLEYEITQAPDILKLKNSEKFKDDEGNIIDIEVRGNKNDSECYFLVKDVASGFDIKRLHSIIINNCSGYKINIHYIYFNIQKQKNGKIIVKKELFLTHIGFIQFIYRSRINNVKYKKTVYRWLSQFKSKTPKKFILGIEKMSKKSKIGFTYLISSPLLNAVKIGAWRSNLKSLRSRYITGYGEDLSLFAIKTADAFALEKNVTNVLSSIDYPMNYMINNIITNM
nr:MUTS family DNA binding domain protein [Mimivirus sp.]